MSVPGTEAAALIVPRLAASLTAVLDQRKLLARRIEELLETHPLSKALTSMPGVGVRTGARSLIEVGDGSPVPTAGQLAAYAGLAPATRSSGSSIRGEQPSRRGNKQLKRAFFFSAFAAPPGPASRIYYDKKIAQGNTPPRPCSASPDAGPTSSSRWNLLRVPASRRCLILSSLAAHGAVALVDRVDHDRMTTGVARPHARTHRLPNSRLITHDSHTATPPP